MNDLTDDFLDSLDSLTVIPSLTIAVAEDGVRDGDETSDSRLSEFSQDELLQFGGYEDMTPRALPIAEGLEVADTARLEPVIAIHHPHVTRETETVETESVSVTTPAQSASDSREYDHEYESEHGDVVEDMVLTASTQSLDLFGSFYTESILKASQRSYQSDGTDRSFSFASECTDFSPLQSPHEVTLADDAPTNYEQRLEASVQEHAKSGRAHNFDHEDGMDAECFTMDDIACFDPHFGRDVFLDELGLSFIDGSGSKSLASYRMSTLIRASQNKSDIIKQGWLMKRGEFVPSWHKRWFTLRRMPQGPMLTYAKDNSESAPAKVIDLSSTSRCVVAPKPSKDHEFRIITSADKSRREYAVYATSNFELTEWVRAIQSSINAGNKSAFEGASDFQRIWNETGIHGFLVRYGMRKVSARNHLQTRVLELNFADQTITNSRRGESLTTLHFNDLQRVSLSTVKTGGEEFGLVLDFNGKHRSWPIFLDTKEARDDLLDIMEKIASKEFVGEDLEARCSRLRLKSGYMERRGVGPQATLKGRLFVCLYENSVVFFPDGEDVSASRPWYVVTLKGLKVSCNEGKCLIAIGRLLLTCDSAANCRDWYQAIVAAISLPIEVIEVELKERAKIRNAFHSSVFRLRKLLKAHVKPEVNGPPKDQKTIEMMMRKLWELTFPGETYTSNADQRWQELGFQRGGPASDLRSSGLLGLYCLIYFVTYPSGEFARILERTRFGVSDGNMKNYPLAIGCINVVAILTETLGFGDAGSHSEGCSPNAMKTFVRFIANTVSDAPAAAEGGRTERTSISEKALDSFDTWEELVSEADNHVFEGMFCLLYPILDSLFVEMGAGYMEFGQVVASFRRRLGVIFDMLPRNLTQLRELAAEPCTDVLVAPSIISKGK